MILFGNLVYSDRAAGSEKPNIVLILADDMGYANLSPFGSTEIKTPHLTKLARSGCTFTNAYVTAPICVPSRMGLITGRYQQRFGIYDNYYGKDGAYSLLCCLLFSPISSANWSSIAVAQK